MIRSIVPAVSVAVLALASLAPTTPAAPFTAHFTDLRAEVVRRRDVEFPGTPSGDGAKAAKALDKALAQIDGAKGADLAGDYVLASRLTAALRKAFPGDFTDPADHDPSFGDLFTGILFGLFGDYNRARNELEDLRPLITEKGAGAMDRTLAKIDALVDAANGQNTQAGYFKGWSRVAKALAKARKAALKDVAKVKPSFTAAVGGEDFSLEFVARTLTAEYESGGNRRLEIHASAPAAGGGTHTLVLWRNFISGPSTYPLADGAASGEWHEGGVVHHLVSDSGDLVIDVMEVDLQRVSGTFTATFMSGGGVQRTMTAAFTITAFGD